jgi:hypothetical protein
MGGMTVKTRNLVSLRQTAAAVAPESGTAPGWSQSGAHRPGISKDMTAPVEWQVTIFATLTLSIIASRFIDYYRAAIPWSPFQDWQYLFFALIVSLLAFPIVYRKAQGSRNEPILVQLGVIFAAGLGWEKMLSTTADLLKPIVPK